MVPSQLFAGSQCNIFSNPSCAGPVLQEFCPQEYSSGALQQFPPCGNTPPFCPREGKFVSIQLPPRVICKKSYVNVKQKVYEPRICPIRKKVDVPHIRIEYKTARIPKINYRVQVVKEPKLIYEPTEWSGPVLISKPKVICEPQEVCTTLICRPKPQYIYVPPPDAYCCDPQGIVTIPNSPPCGPCLYDEPIFSGCFRRQCSSYPHPNMCSVSTSTSGMCT